MNLLDLSYRECDSHGCGHFGAGRGKRKHKGLDLEIAGLNPMPLSFFLEGTVVKIGRVYSSDKLKHFKYIAIQVNDTYFYRVMYVQPLVTAGMRVSPELVLGYYQPLGDYYDDITEHVHLEIYTLKDKKKSMHNKSNFSYIDPKPILDNMRLKK